MRKLLALSVAVILLVSLFTAAASAGPGPDPAPAEVGPEVLALLETLVPGEMATVVVTLHDQADLSSIPGASRAARLNGVIRALQSKAEASQKQIVAFLKSREAQGKVADFTPFWILNAVSVTATADVIQELAERSDVASITSDDIPVVPSAWPPEPNVAAINASDVWTLGYSGQGVVVASLDSGVDVNHPDLTGNWRGGSNSWFDPYNQHPTSPIDLTGHGTGTMGVVVGGDAGGTSIGVAPGAQWIAARIFDDRGKAKTSAIHAAFQWLLDPDGDPTTADAPNVVNNSWSYSPGSGCNLAFQLDLQALRAVGIVPIFAAGNFGPSDSTSVSPANYPESLAVGAVDANDDLYASSGRGPSDCGEASTVYPEIVAPGVNIRTTQRFGLYQNATGTSLAAPHVAGALALLLSFDPDLTASEQEAALIDSAVDLGAPGPDNQFGYGRLDALAAYQGLSGGPPPTTTTTLPASDAVGPITEFPTLAPNPSNGTVDVLLHATGDDTGTGGSVITASEYFIAAPGPDGSGAALTVEVPASVSGLDAAIPAVIVNALSEGIHVLSIHSQDAAGNWGGPVTIDMVVDRTAPTVSGVVASPNPTAGSANATLSAVADDGDSVAGAEWFTGGDPGVGNGIAMTVSGSGPWSLSGSVDVSSWVDGDYTLSVRARDAAGSWSSIDATVLTVEGSLPPFPGLEFSTSGSAAVPDVGGTADNADIYNWDGSTYSRVFDGSADGLPGGANIDGYARVDAAHFYVSFSANKTNVPGLGNVQDEDVIYYNDGAWSVFFDGTAAGLTASGQDVDAISVVGGILYFSTLGNTSVPGVGGKADDADIYSWDGNSFVREWDASANGLSSSADIDGLIVVDSAQFYLSFNATDTDVPDVGKVQDEDVAHYDGVSWTVYFDGTANGLGTSGNLDVNAIDIV